MSAKPPTLSLGSLVLLISISIISTRNLTMSALFGTHIVVFFLAAALLFLIPTGLVAAELTATHGEHSGIYRWVKRAFGPHWGFFSLWLQWINTLIWYPTTLAFLAGSLLYSFAPHNLHHPGLLTLMIMVLFWALTFINLFGFSTSAQFASACAVFGMLLPFALLLVLAGLSVFTGHHLQLNSTTAHYVNHAPPMDNGAMLVAVITSFLGMELASVHVNQVPGAQTLFPKAIVLSTVLILFTLLSGSLAIAITVPADQINLVHGVVQVFSILLNRFHLGALQPVVTALICCGGLGCMVNWMISPAQGLLQASKDHYLPAYFAQTNRHGVPHRLLILQAIIVSVAACAFYLMDNPNASYWILTDLSTELYVGMYLLLLISAVALHRGSGTLSPFMRRLGGTPTLLMLCALGSCGCVLTLLSGFEPPSHLNLGHAFHFNWIVIGGLVTLLLPCALGYRYRHHATRLN